jgi:hypothetical protein
VNEDALAQGGLSRQKQTKSHFSREDLEVDWELDTASAVAVSQQAPVFGYALSAGVVYLSECCIALKSVRLFCETQDV